MTRNSDEELIVRKSRRNKYFEVPNYYRWSKILETYDDVDNYSSRRDSLFIPSMIMGRSIRSLHTLSIDDLLSHKDDPYVNWSAIYSYVDESVSDDKGLWRGELTGDKLALPVPIKTFLDDYRDLLLNKYDFV